VCADVTSLYPNIPIILGVQFMRDRLSDLYYQNPHLFNNRNGINFLCDFTQWTLEHNYIAFGNTFYQQIQGTAMGTPVAVVFANLFLQQLETLVF
jgi:ABC-type phosphate/phosphonate transport system permease subunit